MASVIKLLVNERIVSVWRFSEEQKKILLFDLHSEHRIKMLQHEKLLYLVNSFIAALIDHRTREESLLPKPRKPSFNPPIEAEMLYIS